jgi:Domain of unknown function (DUF6321)
MAKTTTSRRKAPWDRSNPRKRAGKASKHLSPSKKAAAKASAKRAGRHYPNLVDNMRMATSAKKTAKKTVTKTTKKAAKKAAKKTAKKTAKKSAWNTGKNKTRKKTAKKTAKKSAKKNAGKKAGRKASGRKPVEKDPEGGLTAAGRRAFAQKDGSHLKPGVTKRESEMTPADMRRKGSWAVRFYGRAKLPPLVDDQGRPTRHALSAHAWGERVPKTVAAARKIAAKGERLLAKYQRAKRQA